MILIIDDDPAIRTSLTYLLRHHGLEPVAVGSPDEALPYFRSGTPRLALMDMNFTRSTSGHEGLHLLRQVHIFMPSLPVILITAWGSIDLAVEGMRNGAFDSAPATNRYRTEPLRRRPGCDSGRNPAV